MKVFVKKFGPRGFCEHVAGFDSVKDARAAVQETLQQYRYDAPSGKKREAGYWLNRNRAVVREWCGDNVTWGDSYTIVIERA